MTKAVSIIVPVYNQQKYVAKCLQSIMEQSYKHLEIIVVNDGSTDSSLEIVNKLALQDSRIRIISKQNEGVSMARKTGLSFATGKYLMFVDSDDMLMPKAVEHMVEVAEKQQVDVVCGQMVRLYPPPLKKKYIPVCQSLPINLKVEQPELFERFYVSFFGINIYPVQMWSKLYRFDCIKHAMKQEKLFDEDVLRMGEDEFFNLMLFPYMQSFWISDQYIYVYRYGGITSHYNPHFVELLEFSDKRILLLDKYNYEKGYNPLFTEYKNVLLDILAQQILYKVKKEEDIKQWLYKELNNREIVKRMQSYYQTHKANPELSLILKRDVESVYALAQNRVKKSRFRFIVKQIIAKCSSLSFR